VGRLSVATTQGTCERSGSTTKPKEVFMKKKATQPKAGQYKDELTIVEPMKVRLSKKGNTVMVFLNQKTVMFFSKKFLDAVINRKYQKKGA